VAHYYFDTDPLMRWAESLSTASSARSTSIGGTVEALIRDKHSDCAISEITLAEFHNHVYAYRRDSAAPHFDDAWVENVQPSLMRWIAAGQLMVLSQIPSAIEKAIIYVSAATREHRARFKTWDAVHLHYASNWARECGDVVIIVTNDPDFQAVLDIYPAFRRFVSLRDPTT
jgi:hypothetical protein